MRLKINRQIIIISKYINAIIIIVSLLPKNQRTSKYYNFQIDPKL